MSDANNVSDRIANDLPTTRCACEHPACQACRDRRVAARYEAIPLTLSNGNVLHISPDHDARVSSVRPLACSKGLRIITKTSEGRVHLAGELRAWGAHVEEIGARALRVSNQ